MALNTGGQLYGGADRGVDAPQAALYGAADAAVEYGTEKMPVGLLFKDLKAGTPFFNLLTRQLAGEIPGEQAATVLQDLNEWSVLHPEKSLQDYLAERPDAAMQTSVATLVGSGGQTGIVHGVNAIANRIRRQTYGAGLQYGNIQRINQLAATSKVLPRDADTVKSFVDAAVANGPAQHVYIDAKSFAQADMADKLAAALPDAARQLPEALASGGEISIPLSDYVTRIAPQEFAPQLLEHIRLEGEEFSRAEAVRYLDGNAEELKAEVERGLSGSREERAFRLAVQTGRENIRRRLQDVLFAAKVNDHYAMLLSQYYAVQAKKFGVSPEELLLQYPLRIAYGKGETGQRFQQLAPEGDNASLKAARKSSLWLPMHRQFCRELSPTTL